jgi:hypothetical protein
VQPEVFALKLLGGLFMLLSSAVFVYVLLVVVIWFDKAPGAECQPVDPDLPDSPGACYNGLPFVDALSKLDARTVEVRQRKRARRRRHAKAFLTGALVGPICPGIVYATILSWEANHSFLWANLHGPCGWVYVAYQAWVERGS